MITLDLNNEFTFETSDGTTLTGTFRDFNAIEKADFEKRAKKNIKIANKVDKLVKRIETNKSRMAHYEGLKDFNNADRLMDENESLTVKLEAITDEHNPSQIGNDMFRDKFNLCLSGKDRDTILKIGEEIGFKRVYDVIIKAISEGKSQG